MVQSMWIISPLSLVSHPNITRSPRFLSLPCRGCFKQRQSRDQIKSSQTLRLPITGWWFLHPSEKYEFVNWDDYSQYDDIPNIYIYICYRENKTCSIYGNHHPNISMSSMSHICCVFPIYTQYRWENSKLMATKRPPTRSTLVDLSPITYVPALQWWNIPIVQWNSRRKRGENVVGDEIMDLRDGLVRGIFGWWEEALNHYRFLLISTNHGSMPLIGPLININHLWIAINHESTINWPCMVIKNHGSLTVS